jgi:hypothetical protein
MQNELKICSHCGPEFFYRLIDDVGLYAHWGDGCYCVDVVLIFEKRSLILLRELYMYERNL